jgi:phosphatidylserine/phosphatidylglycerophosphate/cardiolipin synthase-like enzyme
MVLVVVAIYVAIEWFLYVSDEVFVPPAPIATPALPPTRAPEPPGERPRQPGWYTVYFTQPIYPDRPANRTPSLDATLVALLDQAQRSIDLAIYDFDLEIVAEALARAANRGVNVRMVIDSDTLANDDEAIQQAIRIVRRARIPLVEDQRPSIMHHKFAIVDASIVWTGSWNMTVGDTYRLNNSAIRIRSLDLARIYLAEFEQMFSNRHFGRQKDLGAIRQTLEIDGTRVEVSFAPPDQTTNQIVSRLQQAQRSIQFMAFSFTSDAIGDAMLERARRGVRVSGVFENTGSETEYSEFGRLRRAGLNVLQDGNPYAMHHKVIIIDKRTVILGSFNFSNNAERENDENLLIIDDPALALAFSEEFARVQRQAQK